MKAPDAVLVRSRAKAPLHGLQALHLSSAELSCLRGLESCRLLRSLYANANALKDIDGLTALRRLWRVDLSDNNVRQLQPLASFAALGFVNLERNQLTFNDLVCLRDVHIMELRLAGNRSLGPPAEYRMKVVALLPYVWILDGNFVTTLELAEALETNDDFVQQVLTESQPATSSLQFGSTSDLWGGSSLVLSDDLTSPIQEEALKLLQVIEKQPTRLPEQKDLYRLRAVASFHDNESDVHNAHAHFAPQKHSSNAKRMPKIRLQQASALSHRTRLELGVLLATHLSFPLPGKLLSETLMITLLSDGGAVANLEVWIDELTQLPPSGHVALVSAMRKQTLEEVDVMRRNHQALPSPLEMLLWESLPGVIKTLLTTERQSRLVDRDVPDQAFIQRCAFAVSLLVRATSFPDTTTLTSSSTSSLMELVETARLASTQALDSVGFMFPSVLLSDGETTKKKPKHPEREYRRPWSEKNPVEAPRDVSIPGGTLAVSLSLEGGKRRRLPRPGEWLELSAKFFLRITSVTADSAFVSATGASSGVGGSSCSVVTLRLDQIERVSSSMWRLTGSDEQLLAAILSQLGQTPSKARLGKLHRDSDAYHRHGAARSQGFPNRSLSCQDLRGAVITQEDSVGMVTMQPQPVELFSSADTLDANYVLTSPALVSLQNMVAARSLRESHQTVGGLWRPIESPCFQVMQANNTGQEVDTPSKKIRFKKPHATPIADDWLALQRDMQALLGIQPETRDVDCFITSVPADEDDARRADNNAQSPANSEASLGTNAQPSPHIATASKTTASVAKPKRLAALSWHHVATKPQLLVASNWLPVGSSPQKKTAISALTNTMAAPLAEPTSDEITMQESLQSTATIRPGTGGSSSSARTPMRLTRCHVSLPSLSMKSQK